MMRGWQAQVECRCAALCECSAIPYAFCWGSGIQLCHSNMLRPTICVCIAAQFWSLLSPNDTSIA